VFFVVGTLKQQSVINEEGKKSYRTAPNISHLKSWIIDLDVGKGTEKKPKYATQADAIKSISKLCRETGLPIPLFISSGYGVHVYWIADTEIPADLWQETATKFKLLLAGYGVITDTSRTSDVASVLRVVGTSNFKNKKNPRPVHPLNKPNTPISPKAFLTIVEAALKQVPITKPTTVSPSVEDETGLGSFHVEQEPADLITIGKKCNQIKQILVTKGNVNQTYWYRGLQLLQFTKFKHKLGRELGHLFSTGHPNYSATETDAKLDQASKYGPTLCAKFEDANNGGCDGCKFRGKIKTPLVLGRNRTEAEPPTMEVQQRDGTTEEVVLPNPPEPWIRTSDGKLGRKMPDEHTGEDYVEIFYDYDIYPTKRLLDQTTGVELFYFTSYLPKDGWREYEIPANLVYDEKQLFMNLASRGVMPDIKHKKSVTAYMHAYMKHLQTLAPAESIYSQMGWSKDETQCVVGDIAYRDDGSTASIKLQSNSSAVLNNFETKGSLEEWKKVISIYKKPGHEDLAMALMTGFGAPMFKFSGFEGGVFSLNGTSGAGKSTILKAIHSIYGKPIANAMLKKDTSNAKSVILSAYNNLPVTFDEITTIGGEEASKFVFDVTDGRDKQRLNSDASLKGGTLTWGLILFTTTNRSLPQLVLAYKPEASGEMMRILECRIDKIDKSEFVSSRKHFDPLTDNYGLAGPIIMPWYVENLAEAKKLLLEFTDKLGEAVDAQIPERFWLSMGGTSLLGCHVGRELGLHDFKQDELFDQWCAKIRECRVTAEHHAKNGPAILTDFLNNHLGQTMAIYTTDSGQEQIRMKPRGDSLTIRNELNKNRIYIDVSAVLSFCAQNGYDFGGLQSELLNERVILRTNGSISLGKGTELNNGNTKVWVINSASPLLAGTMPTLVQDTPPTDAKINVI
jgi:hypothetical protein